jgi:ABC-type transport system substrate-binding protein
MLRLLKENVTLKGLPTSSYFATIRPVSDNPVPAGSARSVTLRRICALLMVLFCLSLLAVTGCTTGKHGSEGNTTLGNGGATGGNGTTTDGGDTAANTLRYPLTTGPTDLDPARVQDGTTIDLLQNIFEGLVGWDDHSQVVPRLAEKWDVSKDGKTYTFQLRHGAKFHNGREMTAEDFKYSLDRACNPATKSQTVSSYLNDIVGAMDCFHGTARGVSGVKVVDPYTLQITIDAPKSYWLGKMTYPTGYVVCKEAIEKNGGNLDERAAVGTGPFKLDAADYQQNYQVTLTAFDAYHEGRPKVDRIIRPGGTRLSKYEAGELDYVTVNPADLDRINSDPKLKPDLHTFARAATWYVALNQASKGSPFTDKRVRQAFAMAIDKDEVLRVAMKGMVDRADAIVPPHMGSYVSKVTPLPYDPTKARALLAAAGYGPGKKFPEMAITCRNDQPEVQNTAQLVAQQIKTNLGIDIALQPMEWGTFLKERTAKTMPLSHLRWAADYLDPQDYLSVLLHTSKVINGAEDHPENGVGYSNAQFDQLCDRADVEPDPAKRVDLYQQAERIAVDDAPWVPLYFQKDLELVKPRVGNLRDSLLGHLPHLTTTVK